MTTMKMEWLRQQRPRNQLGGTENTTETSVTIVGVPARCRTGHLRNKCQNVVLQPTYQCACRLVKYLSKPRKISCPCPYLSTTPWMNMEGGTCYSLRNLNLGTRWRWVVPRRFISRKLAPIPTEEVRERASEWRSGRFGEQEISLSLSANEPCSLCSPIRSPHQCSCNSYLLLTDLPKTSTTIHIFKMKMPRSFSNRHNPAFFRVNRSDDP
jgi:hypothetical protein